MTDSILYFEQKILTKNIDSSEFSKVMLALQERDYKRVNLKPLKGHKGFYRAKTDYQRRIVLTTLVRDGRTYLVVVEHITDHKYDKSKSLKATKSLQQRDFDDQLKNSDSDSDSDDSEDELTDEDTQLFQTIFKDVNTTTFTAKKAFCVKHTYISLSDCQDAVIKLPKPLIVNGLPGSGKTVLLFDVLLDFVLQNPRFPTSMAATSSTTPLPQQATGFYVAASAPFVASIKKDWLESASVPANEDRIQFMSYREFAVLQDPSLVNKTVVGLREFIIWTKNKAIGILNPRTIYKDLRFVSICKMYNDYKKLGVRNLHYHQPDQMQIIWNLFADYKKHLGNTLVDLAFAEYNITHFCDILCLDETQDLSLIQIVLLILSAKNKQFCLAMDVNQSLFLDVSIRPLLMQILAQHNYEVSPANVFLRANHRLPQPIADVATLFLKMKNHLLNGVVDSHESFSLEDIQGNDKPGQVVLLLKPNPQDKKPEIPLTDQNTLNEQTIYLRQIARQTDTAFIVPNEAVRLEVIEYYGATQVFLDDEAKGMQWANVIAVGMIGSSDALELFQKANQDLPKNADDLHKNPNRPKNKYDNSQTEYNSAFASPLVAISRCTETLYIVETYSRKIVRVLDLLQQSITPAAVRVTPKEKQVVTKAMWVEQIKKLIVNENMPQAILAARQELALKVDDTVTESELLQLIETPESSSIGLSVGNEKQSKPKNAKKKSGSSSSSSSSSTSKIIATRSVKLDKLFLELLEKYCAPNTLNQLFSELAQPPFAKSDLLSLIIEEKIQNKIMSSGETGMKLLDYLFKQTNYVCDKQFITTLVLNSGAQFSKLFKWLMSLETGVGHYFELFNHNPEMKNDLLLPLSRTSNAQRSLAKLAFHESELIYWFVANSLNKSAVQLASKVINLKFDNLLVLQKELLSRPLNTREQLFDLCKIIISNDDLFPRLFFVSLQVDEQRYSIPLFFKIASDELLINWFIGFLDANQQLKLKFEHAFGHECLVTRFLTTEKFENPFERLVSWKGFQYNKLTGTAKNFIIRHFANPECVLADDNVKLQSISDASEILEPMLNSFMWLTLHLVKNPRSSFLMILANQPDITAYLAMNFYGSHLKADLRKLLGDSYLPDWNSLPEDFDMLDLLLLSYPGIDFLFWLTQPIFNLIQKRLLAKLQQNIDSLLPRMMTYENGLLLLKRLQLSEGNSFDSLFDLVRKKIAADVFSLQWARNYQTWIEVFQRSIQIKEVLESCKHFLNISPMRDRDSRISLLSDLATNPLCKKAAEISASGQSLLFDSLYTIFYQQGSASFFQKLGDNDQQTFEFLMLVLSQTRRFSGLNLPMSLLFGCPLQNSRYTVLSNSHHGRLLLEVLLRIRTFDLSSITAEQLIYSLQSTHDSSQNNELSLFYILTVTAGDEGKSHLIKLAESNQQIYALIHKADLLLIGNSPFYKGANPDEFAYAMPMLQLSSAKCGTDFLKKYMNYATQHNIKANIFNHADMKIVEIYQQKLSIKTMIDAGLKPDPNNKSPIQTTEINVLALQSYIQGNAFHGANLIRTLCAEAHLLKEFNAFLDAEQLIQTPVTLKMLLDEDVVKLLFTNDKMGITVLSKIFRNGSYFNDSPELLPFFKYIVNGKTVLNCLMQSAEGVKLLYDAIELSVNTAEHCVTLFEHHTVSSLRNGVGIDVKLNEVILQLLGKKFGSIEIVSSVVSDVLRKTLQLQLMYHKKMDGWFNAMGRSNSDMNRVGSEYLLVLKSIFASRDFARLFFMTPVVFAESGEAQVKGSFFLRIMSHYPFVAGLAQVLKGSESYEKSFRSNFNFGCFSQKGFLPVDKGTQSRIESKIIVEVAPIICEEGLQFLMYYFLNPLEKTLIKFQELENLIRLSIKLPVLSDPLVWLTIYEIEKNREFFHHLQTVDLELIKIYMAKNFSGKDLRSCFLEYAKNDNHMLLKIDEHVFDMIDLLSLSRSGVSFLAAYLDFSNDIGLVSKLLGKFIESFDCIINNKKPYFLSRLFRYEGSATIVNVLIKKHSDLLESLYDLIQTVLSSNLTEEQAQLMNLFTSQLPRFVKKGVTTHLYGGKKADYAYYSADSRASTVLELVARYNTLSPRAPKGAGELVFSQTSASFFRFTYVMFYSDLYERFNLFCAVNDSRDKFIHQLYKVPSFIASKNLPMTKLISTPHYNCLYFNLSTTKLGREFIGFLLQFRTFCLDTITPEQLIYSMVTSRYFIEEGAAMSLFFVLTVTAGELGHSKLLQLLKVPEVSLQIQKSDLFMHDKTTVFTNNDDCTPYSCLQTTKTGLEVYKKLTLQNPTLFHHNTTSSNDDNDNSHQVGVQLVRS